MGWTKNITFEVQVKQQLNLGFHDVISVVWSQGTGILTISVGSWNSKTDFQNGVVPGKVTTMTIPNQFLFSNLTKLIQYLLNDPGSIFNGGIPDNV